MTAWYKESFGKDYLLVYKHRDMQGAYEEVKRMAAWLNLPEKAKILDLCCGMGRHSLALTEFGYRVTGIDLSKYLLAEAQRIDPEGTVRWMEGDMRDIGFAQEFDAVVNLFTSFGYFERDEENAKVFAGIYRALLPGGKYIIDYLNPTYIKRNLVPFSTRDEEGVTIEQSRSIEDGFVRKRIVMKEVGKSDRTYLEQVKLYERPQFSRMLEDAGLDVDRVYGNYDGSLYDEDSPRMIFVGSKHTVKGEICK